MIKRTLLFILTNIAVIATLSIVTNMLGVKYYIGLDGIDYRDLALFSLIWGMGGALISLWLSRWFAKMYMNVEVINVEKAIGENRKLLDQVYRIARQAGLSIMPEVGVYQSAEVNAFATGPTRNRALVAVSSGLINVMDKDEIEGVLAHEISHITNGDMVTMTLLQGVLNAFGMFLSRVLAYTISAFLSSSNDKRHNRYIDRFVYALLVIIFDILITLLGSIVVASFSRYREYRADRGGAALVGRTKMIAALEKLRFATQFKDTLALPAENRAASNLDAFKISKSSKSSGLYGLLASHPDLDARIQALQAYSF